MKNLLKNLILFSFVLFGVQSIQANKYSIENNTDFALLTSMDYKTELCHNDDNKIVPAHTTVHYEAGWCEVTGVLAWGPNNINNVVKNKAIKWFGDFADEEGVFSVKWEDGELWMDPPRGARTDKFEH